MYPEPRPTIALRIRHCIHAAAQAADPLSCRDQTYLLYKHLSVLPTL